MEGKSGINLILNILAILLTLVGIAGIVLFVVKIAIPLDGLTVTSNLYIGGISLGLGLLMLIGCNIATNARIQADNSYDILRHVELLCNKEGVSLADLARKDAATAAKIEEIIQKSKLKKDLVLAQQKASVAEAVVAPVEEVAPIAVAPVEEPIEIDNNLGIAFEDWKTLFEGKAIVCKSCGSPAAVRNLKKTGVVVLACNNAAKKEGCESKPIPVSKVATAFVAWQSEIVGVAVASFSSEAFAAKVAEVSFDLNGEVYFVAK